MTADDGLIVFAAEPNSGPDAARDIRSLHEQLTARRNSAERQEKAAASKRERAEREEGEWREQVERYDELIRALPKPKEDP